MDAQKRLAFLEEIGSQAKKIGSAHAIGYIFVEFSNEDGPMGELSLVDAIHNLGGDVYYFEEFDLRDAISLRVFVC